MNLAVNRFFNLFFLVYLIVKPAIGQLVLGFDGAGRIIALLAGMVLLTNFSQSDFWQSAKCKPFVTWFLWCVYVSVFWFFSSDHSSVDVSPLVFIFNSIFVPVIALCVACYEAYKDPKTLAKVIFYAFCIYCLMGCVFQRPSTMDERGGDLLGNDLPLTAVCMLAVAAFRYVKHWSRLPVFVFSIFLCTYAIILVATRKAFAGELIILAAVLFSIFDFHKAKNFVPLILLIVVAYFVFGYVIDNTMLGARFGTVAESAEKFNTTGNPILNLLGDRAYFYINGWEIFTKHPLTGIGLMNFRSVMDTSLPIHSEYIVQLCEAGLIGSALFVLYNYYLFRTIKYVEIRPEERGGRIIAYGWMLALLFISLTAWTYQFPKYFIVTGLFVGYFRRVRLMA